MCGIRTLRAADLAAIVAAKALCRLSTPTGNFVLPSPAPQLTLPPYRRSLLTDMNYKILLVDDHELVREGIKRVLESHPDLIVCGDATNGQEAVEKARELSPNLIVMDLSMPIMGGIEATREIRRLGLPTSILILSLHDSTQARTAAQQAGADGYLPKSRTAEDLVEAIVGLLHGNGNGHRDLALAPTLQNSPNPASATNSK